MRDMAHLICLIKLSNNDEKKIRFFVSDYLKPLFKFVRPLAQMNLAFKPRTVHMKTK